jgi:hypothetical protein
MPELRWMTPLLNSKNAEKRMVCLGGYGTPCAPAVDLEALCTMLRGMLRYHNDDDGSAHHGDAALRAKSQSPIFFSTGGGSLRHLRSAPD